MAKKSTKGKGRKQTPSNRAAGAGRRAAGRSGAGAARTKKAGRKTGRKTAATKPPKPKVKRKGAKASPKTTTRKGGTKKAKGSAKPARRRAKASKTKAAARPSTGRKTSPSTRRRPGGTGMETELAQTPETGRTVKGRTNPMPTKRSTGTAAGAGNTRRAPGLERERKRLRELEESIPTPPSSLDLDRSPSAARSGRAEMREARQDHNETSPVLTGGDVDANWEDAYAVGDEAPGGDNPTPDQDRVDDIGKALGVTYEDNEELKASDKITERDRHRWELDPASSEDYRDRDKEIDEE